jgi:hypothetical protein
MAVDLNAQGLGFGYFGGVLAEECRLQVTHYVPNLDFAISPVNRKQHSYIIQGTTICSKHYLITLLL